MSDTLEEKNAYERPYEWVHMAPYESYSALVNRWSIVAVFSRFLPSRPESEQCECCGGRVGSSSAESFGFLYHTWNFSGENVGCAFCSDCWGHLQSLPVFSRTRSLSYFVGTLEEFQAFYEIHRVISQ